MSAPLSATETRRPIIVWFDQTLSLDDHAGFNIAIEYPGPVLFITVHNSHHTRTQESLACADITPADSRQQQINSLAKELTARGFVLDQLTGPTCDAVLQFVAFSGAQRVLTDTVQSAEKQQVILTLHKENVELISS